MKRKKPVPKKAKHDRGRKKKIEGLVEWFLRKVEVCRWICEECGEQINASTRTKQFAAQAHLLPKEHFLSVATNDDNHKTIGAECGCHRKYDKNWESAQKMKVWPTARAVIITKLIPLLTPEEYRRLPDCLKEFNETLGNTSRLDSKDATVSE